MSQTIPNIKKIEYWSAMLVQDFCIKNKLYTFGYSDEYTEMLRFIRKHEPTTENLYIAADNILKHSSDEAKCNFITSDIMSMLKKQTVTVDYIIYD